MRPNFFLGLLLTCTSAQAQVTLSGTFLNAPPGAEVEITCVNNTIEFTQVAVAHTALDAQGHFTLHFPWTKATEAQLQLAEQQTSLFLSPGDSLVLRCDYAHFDSTLHYAGRGAAENNYMAADVLGNFDRAAAEGTALIKDAGRFTLFVDSIEQVNQALLQAQDTTAWSAAFRQHVRTEVKYRYVYPRCMYKIGYDQEKNAFVMKDMPAGYFDFLQRVDLDDQAAYDNDSYSIALDDYVAEDPRGKLNVPDSLTDDQEMALRVKHGYTFRQKLFKGKVRDHQLTKYVRDQLGAFANQPDLLAWLINRYKADCTTPDYVAIIDGLYATAQRLMPGKPAPEFTLVDTAGESISLADLKGKVIFMDYWATWCGPCIVAMPKVKALEEQFKDRADLVFLKVNVNDDRARWIAYLTKNTPGGLQLFADERQSAELRKAYNFDGIPHVVLVGKDGKLVDANTYPELAGDKIAKALEQ